MQALQGALSLRYPGRRAGARDPSYGLTRRDRPAAARGSDSASSPGS
jgi:hypothetical protein